MGDSTATVSPGCATARSARFSASMQPLVGSTSSGASVMPTRTARWATASRKGVRLREGAASVSISGRRRSAWPMAARSASAGYSAGAPRAMEKSSRISL